jgi:hypothetical protein
MRPLLIHSSSKVQSIEPWRVLHIEYAAWADRLSPIHRHLSQPSGQHHANQIPAVVPRLWLGDAGWIAVVKVMRIPCFGRRMTIGRGSID